MEDSSVKITVIVEGAPASGKTTALNEIRSMLTNSTAFQLVEERQHLQGSFAELQSFIAELRS